MLSLKYVSPITYLQAAKHVWTNCLLDHGIPLRTWGAALGEDICFVATSRREYWWRAKASYTAEPATMRWIETCITPADIVYDIGANVGAYSLLIGRRLERAGGKVLAFEPESANFHSLNRNIIANKLSETVTAYCLAFDSSFGVSDFFLSSTIPGSATHSVGRPESEGISFAPAHRQGILTLSLDDFPLLPGVPFPNHIKIDVDGNEKTIVENGHATLADPRTRSLLIEVSENVSGGKVEKAIERMGFREACHDACHSIKHGTVRTILYVKG